MRNNGFLILLLVSLFSANAKAQIKIGVFADCQFCNCETQNNRFYRNSLQKLDEAIARFNQNNNLEFIVNLGDLIDRNIKSFQPVNSVLEKSEKQVFHVIGNHDLEVEKEFLKNVPEKLGMTERFYVVEKPNWTFIFLDGNDISFLSPDPETVKQAEKITAALKENGQPNYHSWNGGIGSDQLNWLKYQLKIAEKQQQKVALFCHYPLLPKESHALWNNDEVLATLKKHKCVKLWMNGHNHAGNYAFFHGIHFVNLKGMVETEVENAFAEVTFANEFIEIKGFENEKSRSLRIE